MSKFTDHAAPVLRGEPTITQDQRADLHDLFHVSKDTTELAQHLSNLPQLHPMLVADLLKAKAKPAIEYDSLDRATQAIHRVSTMNKKTLELAETHPVVLKHLVDSVSRDEEIKL